MGQSDDVVDTAQIARIMLRVVGRVNGSVLQRIDELAAVYRLIAVCTQHTAQTAILCQRRPSRAQSLSNGLCGTLFTDN